jgi:hypothetical protein
VAVVVVGFTPVGAWWGDALGATPTAHAKAAVVKKHKRHRKHKRRTRAVRATRSAPPLTFGIYPGGAAGTVGPSGVTKPEVPGLRLGALQQLRAGARPFVLHIYDSFTHRSDGDVLPAWLAQEVSGYTGSGFRVELVLAYRPAASDGDVAGFVDFVRKRVRQLGPDAGVTALQVTNEANVGVAPNASDGFYPGAIDALVQGVVAAKDEVRGGGFSQLKIGFNWANQLGPSEIAFWRSLGARGGTAFSAAVDWVGIDAYPGTWGPALPAGDLATATRRATLTSLRALRRTFMPLAGIYRAPIRFAESGYPTGPERTDAMQNAVLRAAVRAVSDYRRAYNVSDYRWFDLRDADSDSGSFESRYGLMRDDYTPKPAFAAYRALVARLS